MGPPPRSFAADAHDCIMVVILADPPNTSLWRDLRAQWRAPLGSSLTATGCRCAGDRQGLSRSAMAVRPPLTVTARKLRCAVQVGTRRCRPPVKQGDGRPGMREAQESGLTLIAPYKCPDPFLTPIWHCVFPHCCAAHRFRQLPVECLVHASPHRLAFHLARTSELVPDR